VGNRRDSRRRRAGERRWCMKNPFYRRRIGWGIIGFTFGWIQGWLGLIDNLIVILTLNKYGAQFEMDWTCWYSIKTWEMRAKKSKSEIDKGV